MTSAVGVSMDADRATGSARRRRERRLRSWWRHERMSIVAALVEATYHSAPRSGWPGTHVAPRGQETTSVREDPELFTLFEEELGGCRPDRLAALSEPQGSLPRGARTLSAPLLCVPRLDEGGVAVDSSALAFLEEEEKRMDQFDDLILSGAHVSAADRAAWRRWALNPPSLRGGRRKKRKRRKKKLPKGSFRHGRPCDHATPAVFAAREREGSSDSVHRQTLELPAAPQRQVLTVQTVQVFGDSTLQFLGEVVDAPVVATTGAGDGPDSADSGGSTAAAPGLVCGLARCCARQGFRPSCSRTRPPTCPFCWSRPCRCSSWTRLLSCPLQCNDTCPWCSRQCSSWTRLLKRPLQGNDTCLWWSRQCISWTRLLTCPLQCIDTCPRWSRQCSSRTRMLTCPLLRTTGRCLRFGSSSESEDMEKCSQCMLLF